MPLILFLLQDSLLFDEILITWAQSVLFRAGTNPSVYYWVLLTVVCCADILGQHSEPLLSKQYFQ